MKATPRGWWTVPGAGMVENPTRNQLAFALRECRSAYRGRTVYSVIVRHLLRHLRRLRES